MAPALLDSQFASMEDPLNEPDVHLVEVWPTLAQVTQAAAKVINVHLLKP
jgi:gluconate kinase